MTYPFSHWLVQAAIEPRCCLYCLSRFVYLFSPLFNLVILHALTPILSAALRLHLLLYLVLSSRHPCSAALAPSISSTGCKTLSIEPTERTDSLSGPLSGLLSQALSPSSRSSLCWGSRRIRLNPLTLFKWFTTRTSSQIGAFLNNRSTR